MNARGIVGINEKPTNQRFVGLRMPHTGFEPVVSALRGLRPSPLDECGAIQFQRDYNMPHVFINSREIFLARQTLL